MSVHCVKMFLSQSEEDKEKKHFETRKHGVLTAIFLNNWIVLAYDKESEVCSAVENGHAMEYIVIFFLFVAETW